MPPETSPLGGSAKNSTALRDVAVLQCVYALWELATRLTKRRLLRAHPKQRGVPLAAQEAARLRAAVMARS